MQFAKTKTKAISLYNQFQLQGLGERQRKEFHTGNHEGRILGSERFAEEAKSTVSKKLENKITLAMVLQAVCRKYGLQR